jgi:biuret amidohydrolase
MAKMEFEAEPFPLEFKPESTALLIIDMQRDFGEPGGYDEITGNEVSLEQSAIFPSR